MLIMSKFKKYVHHGDELIYVYIDMVLDINVYNMHYIILMKGC